VAPIRSLALIGAMPQFGDMRRMSEKCISGKVKVNRVLHVQKYSESLEGWHQLGNMALFSANCKVLGDTS
jgi:hypothetical protein